MFGVILLPSASLPVGRNTVRCLGKDFFTPGDEAEKQAGEKKND